MAMSPRPQSESVVFEGKASVIAREIRQAILSGEYPEGTSLRQRDLAAHFGVSPTPVREALSRLQAEGYVETRLHQGSVVRGLQDRMSENWQLRMVLEGLATELATARIDAAGLKAIRDRAEAFAVAAPRDWEQCNRDFHFEIYRHAESPVLLRFLSELFQTLDVAPTSKREHGVSVREHDDIIDAIARGDGAAARKAIESHVGGTAPQR
ncbi:hypothetical protein AWB98_12345 [Mycolicibacterium conceptionense]|uniref:HTH gntR-type domain-containing protein n=2 Tax=Mycolicibacterium conceptionense TaxID=451644 RepID=A0ABX3VAB9_9MYCO|nr:GntR family transcriptional regulator [Mycolicibacterium conceptionense]ORV27643.1 hypothetical protein AWB98_12345 [Mycolicibacterium conceptionense]